MKVIRLFGNR